MILDETVEHCFCGLASGVFLLLPRRTPRLPLVCVQLGCWAVGLVDCAAVPSCCAYFALISLLPAE